MPLPCLLSQRCTAPTSRSGPTPWGYDFWGQVGDNTNTQRPSPVDVVGLGSGVMAIATGDKHSCALTVSGLSFAWNTDYTGGVLSLAGSSPPIYSIDPVWEVVQIADWNADGKPDLTLPEHGYRRSFRLVPERHHTGRIGLHLPDRSVLGDRAA